MATKFASTVSSTEAIDDALRRFPTIPDDARIRRPLVRALFGDISDRTLDSWMARGLVPRPVHDDPYQGWNAGALRRALRGEEVDA